MLYHSFPGRRNAKQPDKDIQVLESILKYGLLLAADITSYPGKTDENGKVIKGDIKLLQCHFCLTAIDDRKLLKKHAETYGDFHLEFTDASVYAMGAIPVMYVPKARYPVQKTPDSLWHLAVAFIHRLDDLRKITTELEYLDEAAGDFAGEPEITVESDTGIEKAVNPAQLRDILELILDGVVNVRDSKERKKQEFAQIKGAIQSFWPLFNFTDDPPHKIQEPDYPYLKSFREREWRILPGMGVYSKEQNKILTEDRGLTLEEQKTIMAVDSDFFGAELDKVINDRKPLRIELCRILPSINGKPVQSFINRIYVPNERYKEALAVAENNNFPTDKIIPYDKEQGIPNEQEGVTT